MLDELDGRSVTAVIAVEDRRVTVARQTRGRGGDAEAFEYPTRGGGIRYGFDDSKAAFALRALENVHVEGASKQLRPS